MSCDIYNTWKDDEDLPIECLINTILLYNKHREIIQFDLSYYDSSKIKERIKEFLSCCKNIITKEDANGNIIVYLHENKQHVEKKLSHCAFRTSEFADLLDPLFYSIKGSWPSIFAKKRIVQVSFNIIHPSGRTGAVLIQMSNLRISNKISKIYNYFIHLSKIIEEIDPSLQTSFSLHTKPGLWKSSPELVVDMYKII